MEIVLQKNYIYSMGKKQMAATVFYCLALLIVLSWISMASLDEFLHLGSKGFHKSTVAGLPEYMKPFYKGFPNVGTLLCYILLTLAAFLTLKDKSKLFRFINLTSFAMLFWLLFLLS